MIADARVLWQLLRGQARSGSHAQRLQAFYAPQAGRYDQFRERLLHGRSDLIDALRLHDGASVVELGGGTGRNLLFFGERLYRFADVYVVDLCPAMLEVARRRTAGWGNVEVVEADATRWQPSEPVDCVYFSYSLTMIPDWRGAIDNALQMLKPGGTLGVVDFYVSADTPEPGLAHHGAATRWFWPRWFGHDGVQLDHRRLDYLRRAVPDHSLAEQLGSVPFLPLVKVPHYVFVGTRQR